MGNVKEEIKNFIQRLKEFDCKYDNKIINDATIKALEERLVLFMNAREQKIMLNVENMIHPEPANVWLSNAYKVITNIYSEKIEADEVVLIHCLVSENIDGDEVCVKKDLGIFNEPVFEGRAKIQRFLNYINYADPDSVLDYQPYVGRVNYMF